jgi:hypothetical protein
MEKDGKNSDKLQKIQAQPKNLGNNSPPSRNPNGPTKNKACDRIKTASD